MWGSHPCVAYFPDFLSTDEQTRQSMALPKGAMVLKSDLNAQKNM